MAISPAIIKEISTFIQGSKGVLLREFNQLDRNMTGFLPAWDVKKVFHNNGYETIRVDDLEQFATYFGVYSNKHINYPK